MIRFVTAGTTNGPSMSRREWLRIGGLAGLGGVLLPRPSEAASRSTRARKLPGFGKAKSVILVFANGGQSQFETWDPKPDAPAEVRGEFGAIPSAVPGTFLCEYLPLTARIADRYTIVRSISHDDRDHGSAAYLALTGRYHPQKTSNPLPRPATDFPTYGAVLKKVRPSKRSPYTSVHVNGPAIVPKFPAPGQDGGFLGRDFEPLLIGDMMANGGAALPDLSPPPDLPPVRLQARRSLLRSIDSYLRLLPEETAFRAMDSHYQRAYDLLGSPQSRAAFDLASEPQAVRERYGLHRSGQACLLARRLAEAEVPFITVVWNHSGRGQDARPDDIDAFGWDTHNDIFASLRDRLLPRFDQSFSALLEDLDDRGLLDQTLVVCMGEFGRAPRIAKEKTIAGNLPGRKHWPTVYSVVMAGAGVSRGAVLGTTDRIGAYAETERYGPWDIAATMMSALGVDPNAEYTDALARPFPIATGSPIAGLYRG